MLHIAIVEDNFADAEKLEEYIGHFCGNNHINYQTEIFDSGDKFLKNYTKIWNLILLDIEMRGLTEWRLQRKSVNWMRKPFLFS